MSQKQAEETLELREIPVRLAIRLEGDFFNAYIAKADTMEQALLIGSIRAGLAVKAEQQYAWKVVMQAMLTKMLEEVFGTNKIVMKEYRAPESERSGNA